MGRAVRHRRHTATDVGDARQVGARVPELHRPVPSRVRDRRDQRTRVAERESASFGVSDRCQLTAGVREGCHVAVQIGDPGQVPGRVEREGLALLADEGPGAVTVVGQRRLNPRRRAYEPLTSTKPTCAPFSWSTLTGVPPTPIVSDNPYESDQPFPNRPPDDAASELYVTDRFKAGPRPGMPSRSNVCQKFQTRHQRATP